MSKVYIVTVDVSFTDGSEWEPYEGDWTDIIGVYADRKNAKKTIEDIDMFESDVDDAYYMEEGSTITCDIEGTNPDGSYYRRVAWKDTCHLMHEALFGYQEFDLK